MSLVATFNFQEAVESFSPDSILDVIEQVMDSLSPLLSVDSSLDAKVIDMLKNTLDRFVQGVNFIFTTSGHMHRGLSQLCSMLANVDKYPPSRLIARLQSIIDYFSCGDANAVDARDLYVALKRDVEQQIKAIVDSYGTESAVQVSGKYSTQQTSLQTLGSKTNKQIEKIQQSSAQMANLIQGTTQLIRAFLENDQFSLEQPLTDAPIWSVNLFLIWNLMASHFNRLEAQLRPRMRKHPSWFQATLENEHSLLSADQEARRPGIVQPIIKIKVPKDPEHVPIPISQKGMPKGPVRSGECVVRLESIDRTKPGVSSMKLAVSAHQSGVWFRFIKNFYVLCRVTPIDKSSPIRFVNSKPSTVEEILHDPTFQPQNCKPLLTLATPSNSVAKWIFSRPIYRWDPASVIPSDFTISFDLEHTVQVRVDLYAVFTYRRRFMPILTISEQLVGQQDLPSPEAVEDAETQPPLTITLNVEGPTADIPTTST